MTKRRREFLTKLDELNKMYFTSFIDYDEWHTMLQDLIGGDIINDSNRENEALIQEQQSMERHDTLEAS